MNNLDSEKIIGVIEVGSKAVRLLIADVFNGEMRVLKYESLFQPIPAIRLLSDSEVRLHLKKIDDAVEVFRLIAEKHGAQWVFPFGTSIAREIASRIGGNEVIGSQKILVLNSSSEAAFSLCAALSGANSLLSKKSSNILVIDQGGGSLETIIGKKGEGLPIALDCSSYKLGSHELLQLFHEQGRNFKKYKDVINKRINDYRNTGLLVSDAVMLGGTATTSAWLKMRQSTSERFDPSVINGIRVTVEEIDRWCALLTEQFTKNRAVINDIFSFQKDNPEAPEKFITSMIAISAFLRKYGISSYLVSSNTTRHGVAIAAANDMNMIKKMFNIET